MHAEMRSHVAKYLAVRLDRAECRRQSPSRGQRVQTEGRMLFPRVTPLLDNSDVTRAPYPVSTAKKPQPTSRVDASPDAAGWSPT